MRSGPRDVPGCSIRRQVLSQALHHLGIVDDVPEDGALEEVRDYETPVPWVSCLRSLQDVQGKHPLPKRGLGLVDWQGFDPRI